MTALSISQYTVKVDYTNQSAQITDGDGRCVAIYSHVHGRDATLFRIARDGWLLDPDGTWEYTWPPDGRQHPLVYRPRPATPVLDTLALDGPDASDLDVATRIINHFGAGSWVIGVLSDAPHASVHRADLNEPRDPVCGMVSHGVPARLVRALGLVEVAAPYAVLALLATIGVETCRPCKRCWRPTWKIPSHNRSCFHTT